jgi:hypothetical protein
MFILVDVARSMKYFILANATVESYRTSWVLPLSVMMKRISEVKKVKGFRNNSHWKVS